MINRKTKIVGSICIILLAFNACKHDYPEPVAPTISFKDHVQPIITGNCTAAECHPATGGEFPLVSYNDVIKNGEIKEGDGDESELIEVLKETNDNKRMPKPPSAPLTNNQIQIIELWITQGAKNN
jgi:hypothetical protein